MTSDFPFDFSLNSHRLADVFQDIAACSLARRGETLVEASWVSCLCAVRMGASAGQLAVAWEAGVGEGGAVIRLAGVARYE